MDFEMWKKDHVDKMFSFIEQKRWNTEVKDWCDKRRL